MIYICKGFYGIHFVCTKGQSTKFDVPFVEVKECSLDFVVRVSSCVP